MQLVELSLYNFCLYRGEQVFDLSPDRRSGKPKPIVLVGGINGGGKTTLFDSILLALYGSRAKCSKRTNRPYNDFLADCIHRDVDPADGASIALSFRYVAEGTESIYEVRRRWAVNNGVLKESLTVSRDGQRDSWLSSNWNHVIEEILPLGISQLFFFDAEKIRFIAEDDSTSEALGTAIKSMLGLDLVERLIADAKVIEMKLAERQIPTEEQAQIDEWKQTLAELTDKQKGLKQARAGIRNQLERAQETRRKAEQAFASVGGEHWENRRENERKRSELVAQQASVEESLVTLASGEFPLALVTDLLKSIVDQDAIEQEHHRLSLVGQVLDDHDDDLLSTLKEMEADSSTVKLVQSAQDQARSRRVEVEAPDVTFQLSKRSRGSALTLLETSLPSQVTKAGEQVTQLRSIGSSLDSIQRSLAVTPEEADLKSVAEALKNALKEVAEAEAEASRLDRDIDQNERECQAVEKNIEDKLLRSDSEMVRADDAARMSQLASRTRETMRQFLERSTAAKIDRLADHIYESFQYLLRKKTLVSSIHIDPKDFGIQLLGPDGEVISKQRLSEGEKQIFAIAVLWGLGRASHRRLPAIIDTPMARLDATHRENLLTRYFPSASHQTIILSTDTEVDEQYFKTLEPHVARAYLLKYNERKRETTVEEGYFWEHEPSLALQGEHA